jgi:hypothetical protein
MDSAHAVDPDEGDSSAGEGRPWHSIRAIDRSAVVPAANLVPRRNTSSYPHEMV